MPNSTLSSAVKEAYTYARTDAVILDTLELRHPAFIDDNGNPTAVRVVLNDVDIQATLEATAPLDPGASVTFTAISIDVEFPGLEENQESELRVSLDNVGRELTEQLERAIEDDSPIAVTWRQYLSDDLAGGPQNNPPMTMELDSATINTFVVSGVFKFDSLIRKRFPGRLYTIQEFPGLGR